MKLATPLWVSETLDIIDRIDVSKFPIRISIIKKIITPNENIYVSDRWAVSFEIHLLGIRERATGRLSNLDPASPVYLYSNKYVEDYVLAEIENLVRHELYECFQLKVSPTESLIPFDPHAKSPRKIKSRALDKIYWWATYPSPIHSVINYWKKFFIKLISKFTFYTF